MSRLFIFLFVLALSGCGQGGGAGSPSPTRLSAASTDAMTSVSLAGYKANYKVVPAASGVAVTNNITGNTQTYPASVRTVRFVDKHVSFDVDGPGGQAYRLYQAAFNRKPDSAGLGYWVKQSEKGVPARDIAAAFIGSPEFQGMYGRDPTPEAFVGALYQNILHRAPDKAGLDWWVNMVKAGGSKTDVLVSFADSRENQDAVNPGIAGGFSYDYFRDAEEPILPKRSSYENKAAAFASTGPVSLPTYANGEFVGTGYAMADFFQDGRFTLVVNTGDFSRDSAASGYPTNPGKIHFYTRTSNTWVDRTADLLADNQGCISARKLVVADFNGDGRPDVFIACTGLDTMNSPMEHPRFLMSQADGRYANTTAPFICYCHSATAVDINANGFADIVIADPGKFMKPVYLVNQKDGTFTADPSRMPASVGSFSYPGQTTVFSQAIYTVELIDLKGRGQYDLFVGANEPNSFVHPVSAGSPNYYFSSIYWNDGTGHFSDLNRFVIPNLDPVYGLPLDVAFDGSRLYLLRVVDDFDSPLGFYGGVAVQDIELRTMASAIRYRHTGSYLPGNDGQNWKWFPWLETHQGHLRSIDAAYPVDLVL